MSCGNNNWVDTIFELMERSGCVASTKEGLCKWRIQSMAKPSKTLSDIFNSEHVSMQGTRRFGSEESEPIDWIVAPKSESKSGSMTQPGLSEMFAYHATTMANTISTSLVVFSRKVRLCPCCTAVCLSVWLSGYLSILLSGCPPMSLSVCKPVPANVCLLGQLMHLISLMPASEHVSRRSMCAECLVRPPREHQCCVNKLLYRLAVQSTTDFIVGKYPRHNHLFM